MSIPNREKILNLLKDKKPHFSAEFRDTLGLLEYRKRITELREKGYIIESIKIQKRPGYQLIGQPEQKNWNF